MLLRATRVLGRGGGVRTLTSTSATPMPPGAVPQLYLKCHGSHETGIVKDVSQTVSGLGLSIAATQKIALGPQFALLMYLWCPDEEMSSAAQFAATTAHLQADLVAAVGSSADVEVITLDDAEREAYVVQRGPARTGVRFILYVECSGKSHIHLRT